MQEASGYEPGDVIAGYVIESLLGTGGMGSVYLARHPNLPRKVALKLLHRSLTNDDYVRSRFEHEANHAARLEHPNIVAVYDRGRVDDQLWIAMQYVAGSDAAKLLNSGPRPADQAVHIVAETGRALDYAHHLGILHRDVKPANILLAPGDYEGAPERVLLTDFGIAKALDEAGHMTRTGTLVATLHYASPEQIEGQQLDGRADVYSLGCTLFHLLTGTAPYPGPNSSAIMLGHLNRPVPRVSQIGRGVPPALDAVIERAMAKNRDERFRSCAEFATAARAALDARGPRVSEDPTHRIPPKQPARSWPPHQQQRPPTPPPQQRPPTPPPQQRSPATALTPPPHQRPPTPPPQSWPSHPVPQRVAETPPAKRWWRKPIVPIAAVGLVVAGFVGFAVWPDGETEPTTGTVPAPPPEEPNPAASFDGMYDASFTLTGAYGRNYIGNNDYTEQWAVQTHCDESTGPCITSVSTRDPNDETRRETSQFVLDFNGEQWTAARELAKSTCEVTETNTPLEDVDTWDAFAIDLGSDGENLTGNRVRFLDEPCGNRSEFALTLTRTGDLVPALMPPNPANIGPPADPSPALALNGEYQAALRATVTPPGANPVADEDYTGRFTTYCLRTQDRCASVMVTDAVEQGYFFIWVDGTWTAQSSSSPQECATPPDGRTGIVHFLTTLTANDPSADPIQSLSGTEVRDRTGDCAGRWELSQAYERIGD